MATCGVTVQNCVLRFITGPSVVGSDSGDLVGLIILIRTGKGSSAKANVQICEVK